MPTDLTSIASTFRTFITLYWLLSKKMAARYKSREDFLDSLKAHKALYYDVTNACLEEFGPRIWGKNVAAVTDGTNELYPRQLDFEVRSDQEESLFARHSICASLTLSMAGSGNRSSVG
jgi:hypothetical protein